MSEYRQMLRYAGRVYTLVRTEVKGSSVLVTELSTMCRFCDRIATYTMVANERGQTNTAEFCDCLPRRVWIGTLITAAINLATETDDTSYLLQEDTTWL